MAFVTTLDGRDPTSSSGTLRAMAQALEAEDWAPDYVGPLEDQPGRATGVKRGVWRLAGARHLTAYEGRVLDGYARQVSDALDARPADVVLSPEAHAVARLDRPEPVVLWSDASFASLRNYHPGFTRLSDATVASAHEMENQVLHRCAAAIYTSRWAAQTALDHYNADPTRIHVIPYGANLEPAVRPDDMRAWLGERPMEPCRLLFIASDWGRKGGDVALECMRRLAYLGDAVHLDLVGAPLPEGGALPDRVEHHGPLHATDLSGRAQLRALYEHAHLLLVPSRSDCTPIVINEAAAHGVPAIAAFTGGIPELVHDGVNGHLLSTDAEAADYADVVAPLATDPARINALALTTLDEYDRRLSWRAAASRVAELLAAATAAPAPASVPASPAETST